MIVPKTMHDNNPRKALRGRRGEPLLPSTTVQKLMELDFCHKTNVQKMVDCGRDAINTDTPNLLGLLLYSRCSFIVSKQGIFTHHDVSLE